MTDFSKIGKYEVLATLGRGSFGVVYQGRDAYLKRDVAIKICSVEDEGLRQRFFREAEISGKLVHENIVTVYEFGFEGEIPYLVQEMLSGQDLSRLIKRRAPIAPALKLDYLLQIAAGLAYAHSEGVIHRDVKPSNVRVLEDGQVKIMDFGIAKLASAETQLTQKGVTMGTASYLPPEQVRGADLDHRADVFSFGVLAYELLTYERPFSGSTLSALIYQILYKVPAPMSAAWPQCPEPLSGLVARCLQKKPERRFGSFAELIPELSSLRDEVLAGRWPALKAGLRPGAGGRRPGGPPDAAAPEADESSAVLSRSAIAETARGVLQAETGDDTGPMAAPAPEPAREPREAESGRSTRPIPRPPPAAPSPAAEPAPATDAEALATRVLPTPPEFSRAGVSTGERLELAQEIRELVAQGELEAAREQLEATLHSTGLAEGTPEAETPAAEIDATWETRVLPGESADDADAPPAAAAVAPPVPEPAEPAPATAPDAASDTYRTVVGPPFLRLGWIGLAAAAALAAGLGWLLLGRGGREAPAPVAEPREPAAAAVPAATAAPAVGGVAVHAAPWAEVTEITDAAGFVLPLPEPAATPLLLELAPGTYTIVLRPSAGGDVVACDVEVTLGAVASCVLAPGEGDVTAYFKETGWWP